METPSKYDFDDGTHCNYGQGYWKLSVNGKLLGNSKSKSSSFGRTKIVPFETLSDSSSIPEKLPTKEQSQPPTKSPTRPPMKQPTNLQCAMHAVKDCGSAKLWTKQTCCICRACNRKTIVVKKVSLSKY